MDKNLAPEAFNPGDPAIQQNPYPYYPMLRAQKPVLPTTLNGHPCWVVSRREEISTILMNPATYSSRTVPQPSMLFMDSPDHERLRNMVAHVFARPHVARLAPMIEARAEAMLAPLLEAGRAEMIHDFAGPLTSTVTAAVLGIELVEIEHLRMLTKRNAELVLARLTGVEPSALALSGREKLQDFMLGFLHGTPCTPDGVMALLVEKCREGALSEDEFVNFTILLQVAGHSTTTNLIGNSVYTLTQHPQYLARLGDDPEFVTPFIEEVLRTRPSFHRLTRMTTREVELCGEIIPKGGLLRLLIASANRDENFFAEAEEFDPDAKRRQHFAFGQGLHACLGAWLARLESGIVMKIFGRMVAGFALDPEDTAELASGGTFNEFGFERLPVLLHPRA